MDDLRPALVAPGGELEGLEALMDRMPVGVYRTTPEGRFLEANPTLARILGYRSREHLLEEGDPRRHYVDADEREVWMGRFDETGVVERSTLRLRRLDGKVIWVQDVAQAVRDPEGRVIYFEGVLQDVSQQREAEEALRESEERYRRLVEASPEAIVVHAGGVIVYANPTALKLAGASSPDQLLGRPVLDLVHPDYREVVLERIRRVQDHQEIAYPVEERFVRLDGEEIIAEVTAIPTTFQGRPASQVMLRDVTERRRAEEALRESEERFRSSFQEAGVAMAMLSPEGRFLRVNRALQDLLGYSEEELLARSWRDVTHPEDLEVSASYARRALAGELGSWQLEKRCLAADGRVVWVQLNVSLLTDREGRPRHFFSQYQDVTERKRAEEALRESEERYRTLFERTPIAIFQEDFSALEAWMRGLRAAGVEDLRDHLERHPEELQHAVGLIEVVDVNPAAVALFEAGGPGELLGRHRPETVVPETFRAYLEQFVAIWEGRDRVEVELAAQTLRGRRLDGILHWMAPRRGEGLDLTRAVVAMTDISELKRAQEALRESEERFRSAFDHAAVGMAMVSLEGTFLRVNQALSEMLGFSGAELGRMSWRELSHPADLHLTVPYIERLLAGEIDGYQVEKRYVRADGGVLWAHLSVSLVRDARGRPLYYVCQFQDTTARNRAEEALRESEARFRSAFDDAAVGMVLVNPEEGRLIRVNRAFCELVGYPEEQLLARRWADITHPDDREAAVPHLERLVAGEVDSYQAEKRYLAADGTPVWALISVSVVREADGSARYLVGQVQDIRERKRAEEARRRLIDILEATSDLVVIADWEGRFLYANRAARRFQGIEEGADLPAELNVRNVYPAWAFERLRAEALPAVLERGSWSGEMALLDASGREVPVSMVLVGHRDSDGRVEYFSAVVRDITERKEAQERLEELVRSKDEFVASVSHELRTPLTAVVGLAQELRDGWVQFSSEEAHDLVRVVADQATEVGNIVEDLLVAARADIGTVTVSSEPLEVAEQVGQVVAALPAEIRPRVELRTEAARARADGSRVRQVVRNLLTNAARYGGEHIVLEVSAGPGEVVVEVRDDGPGISEEEQEMIFQPYYRAGEARGQPAAVGLGLTVSRQLARLMEGDLTYRYEDGWSIFRLNLPAAS